jgi:peptide/nickel transport system permease protein
VSYAEVVESVPTRTWLSDSWIRDKRPPILIGACFVVMAAAFVCVLFGSLIAPHPATAQDLAHAYAAPSWAHLFGTDALGRDIFSRTIVGSRSAILGPVIIALGSMAIGNVLGVAAGYLGGVADSGIMRLVDAMLSLPAFLIVIVVAGIVGGSYWTAVILLTILSWPFDARMIRASVLEQRPRAYVEAVRVLGLGRCRIMFRHIWPNTFPVVVAITFLDFAAAVVGLAGLSFLGLGAAPGTPDWGAMIADNRNLLLQNPLAPLGPAAALVMVVAATNLIGDWFYERIADRGRSS